jgi:predicted ATPase/DNA-binding SARP family transcriptional activator
MTSSTPTSPAAPAELPVHLTRFIGRDREIDDLARLVQSTRLLTLTGAGGSGKTRLALETALRVASTFSRVVWVDLASLSDPQLLPQQFALALRVTDRGHAAPLAALVEAIGTEHLLLIVDNCEHLVEATAAGIETLLRGCPQLVVFATSREALGVASETAWLVPPLGSDESVLLFVERARAASPAFAHIDSNNAWIAEICRRLDGIPLAIELAAARVRVLSPEQIARRLDDAFRLLSSGSRTALPRHRTLRATMEWSHALLAAREQVLLRRLAVFAGTFTLDAAEAACAGEQLEVDDILDGISTLVDKSLVVMDADEGDARYHLLETVRQYALERLTEAGEVDAIRAAHARFFVAFAESAEPHLFAGAGSAHWIGRVKADVDNLRAASQWAEEKPDRAETALRLIYALHWFWWATGQLREARQRIEAALSLSGQDADPVRRGRALLALGFIAITQGDLSVIRTALEQALPLLEDRDEPRNVAYLLTCLSAGHLFEGAVAQAYLHAERALATVAKVPPHAVHSFVLYYHGRAAEASGDFASARASFEEATRLGRAIGHRPAIAHPLAMLGRLALIAGDHDEAFARFAESLEIHAQTDDLWGSAVALDGLAGVAVLREQYGRAVRLMAAGDSLRSRIASELTPLERNERNHRTERARAALGDNFDRLYAEAASMPKPEILGVALGETEWHTQEFVAAQRVVGAPSEPINSSPRTGSRADESSTLTAGLRVRALGPLQVFIGDRPIQPSAWGSARPRELLVYLLMHPEGRTKEQVGLAFWPDASSAQLRNSFHVTLHRLRKALGGADWVTLVNDRYRIDQMLVDVFDVPEFERALADARRALKRREDGAIARLEQALTHFRGDFLDGEPAGDWHLEHRDHLQRMYVDALMELGSRLLEEERYEKAAEAFRRVLGRDELHEEALLALMRCHAALGERSHALRVYRRFADKLREELEAEPGDETVRFAERLQQGAVP